MEKDKDKGIATIVAVLGFVIFIIGLIMLLANKVFSQSEVISMVFGISFIISGGLLGVFCLFVIRVIDNLYANIRYLEREVDNLRGLLSTNNEKK